MSARRPRIRAPRKNLSQEVDFESSWSKLSVAIQQVFHKNASTLSFEELYRTVYMLVLRKYSRQVYDNAKAEVREYLKKEVAAELVPLINDPTTPSSQLFKVLNTRWADHQFSMKLISDIMMYLDRVYCNEEKVPLTYDAGITLFRDAVIRNGDPPVGNRIFDIVLEEITRERKGESIDRMAVKNVVSLLESLPENRLDGESIYVTDFEPKLEEATEVFYKNAAIEMLHSSGSSTDGDAGVYIQKVKHWLEEETNRCNLYLSEQSTLPKIIKVLDHVLIINQMKSVIERPSGMPRWIQHEKYDEMALLYQLISRVSTTHDDIREFITGHILSSGREINNIAVLDAEEAKRAKATKSAEGGAGSKKANIMNPTQISIKWVEAVLQLKDKYDAVLRKCFDKDKGLQMVIESAFSDFVNENPKAAEFLSLFIDDNLKKSLKGKTDEEIEETLEKAIVLFRFIRDKDLFETYFKAHLAKRLLNNKSISTDAERNMIAKVKMEVGTAFTSKLEGMFRDMEISKELMSQFKSGEAARASQSPIEINVSMLTSSYWPASIVTSQSRCIYPENVSKAKETFEQFYLSKHNGRTLTWNPNMGTADVTARFKKKTHEINMPTYAMIILMLFNDVNEGDTLSYEDIKNATAIPEQDLIRHLQSISVAPRTRLLLKHPHSRNIAPTDKFSINQDFESPMTRIKVLTISSSSKDDQERRQTMDQINKSRKYETDAAIVRIMKARKSMDHPNLVAETTRQLSSRFKPDPSAIKQRIDALLEREYLERDAEERNVYRYLA